MRSKLGSACGPYEAYGCTELSPLVSVNVPPDRNPNPDAAQCARRNGRPPNPGRARQSGGFGNWRRNAVGARRNVAGDGPERDEGIFQSARFDGPSDARRLVRDGRLGENRRRRVHHDHGRESRFSKIGGEMVPHGKIEDLLQRILGGDEEHLKAVVTAVPDEFKGERLVVLHLATDKTPDQIRKELAARAAELVGSLGRQLLRGGGVSRAGKRQDRHAHAKEVGAGRSLPTDKRGACQCHPAVSATRIYLRFQ